jgi:hypothetical protein
MTLDNIIHDGLDNFSKDVKSFVKKIVDESDQRNQKKLTRFFDIRVIPEIFTAMTDSYDGISNALTKLDKVLSENYSEIENSIDFQMIRNGLEQYSKQLFATDMDYERIRKLSTNCKEYTKRMYEDLTRTVDLPQTTDWGNGFQSALPQNIKESNRLNAITAFVKLSVIPIKEDNFDELQNKMKEINELYRYTARYSSPSYSSYHGGY